MKVSRYAHASFCRRRGTSRRTLALFNQSSWWARAAILTGLDLREEAGHQPNIERPELALAPNAIHLFVKRRSGRAEPMPATFCHETGMATSNRFWWTCRANGFTESQRWKPWCTSTKSGEKRVWWTCRDLNSGPLPCQGSDLPTDLHAQMGAYAARPPEPPT